MSSLQTNHLDSLKVALVYDRVNTQYGGAEQVLEAVRQVFPQAHLFTSIYSPQSAPWALKFPKVTASFLNKIKLFRKKHQLLAAFMPLAFESLDLSAYQLVVSVTSAEAKGVITKPNQLHICYMLTPPRYVYDFKVNYTTSGSLLRLPIFSFLARVIIKYLHWWDQVAIFRPDVVIPLSKLTANRIKEAYQIKPCKPLYPPIDIIDDTAISHADEVNRTLPKLPEQYNLIVSRLVPYKRVDLAMLASELIHQNLVIVGDGSEMKRLTRLSESIHKRSNIKIVFLSTQAQEIVNFLISHAKVFLSPGVDDFGLSPLQANIMGTPAVINSRSGVAEVFNRIGVGAMISTQTPQSVAKGISEASSKVVKSANIESIKLELGSLRFKQEFIKIIQQHLKYE